MQVGILGPLTVEAGGRNVPIAGARLRALVTRLALVTPRVVPADELIDDLWGDEPPADRANALQSLVSRARRVLGTGSVPAVGSGYRLPSTAMRSTCTGSPHWPGPAASWSVPILAERGTCSAGHSCCGAVIR